MKYFTLDKNNCRNTNNFMIVLFLGKPFLKRTVLDIFINFQKYRKMNLKFDDSLDCLEYSVITNNIY